MQLDLASPEGEACQAGYDRKYVVANLNRSVIVYTFALYY